MCKKADNREKFNGIILHKVSQLTWLDRQIPRRQEFVFNFKCFVDISVMMTSCAKIHCHFVCFPKRQSRINDYYFILYKTNQAARYLSIIAGIVQNMDWTGRLDWTQDWTGLDSWTGLDWTDFNIYFYVLHLKVFILGNFTCKYVLLRTISIYNWSEISKPKRAQNLWFEMKLPDEHAQKKRHKIVDFFNENYLSLLLSLQIDNSTKIFLRFLDN